MAREALGGAQAAIAILQQLQRITRLEELDQAGPGLVLDLARSVQRASYVERQPERPAPAGPKRGATGTTSPGRA